MTCSSPPTPAPRASASATARTTTGTSEPMRRCTSCTRRVSCTTGCWFMAERVSGPAGGPLDDTVTPEPVCAASDLAERGQAFIWDVLQYGQPVRAFALRFDGRVVAYLNRCVHVPTEMDWQAGEFLD